MKFKNRVLIEEVRLLEDDKRVDHAVAWLQSLEMFEISITEMSELRIQLGRLKFKFNNLFKDCSRKWERFENKHAQWLDSDFTFNFQERAEPPKPKKLKVTRKSFDEKAHAQQSRDINRVSDSAGGELELLLHTARYVAKKKGEREIVKQLDNILAATEKAKPEPVSCLAFFVDNKLSKSQYIETRQFVSTVDGPLLPSYYQLQNLKKFCYPEGVAVTEKLAVVPVQQLHNHTAARLVQHAEHAIETLMEEKGLTILELELMYSWGFDGSTGQSQYNMSSPGTDSSLFATTTIPLKLHLQDSTTIWLNPSPASTHDSSVPSCCSLPRRRRSSYWRHMPAFSSKSMPCTRSK